MAGGVWQASCLGCGGRGGLILFLVCFRFVIVLFDMMYAVYVVYVFCFGFFRGLCMCLCMFLGWIVGLWDACLLVFSLRIGL